MANKNQHEIADKILKLLEKPEDWRVDNYDDGSTFKLIHDEKRIAIWMCSGFWFFELYAPFRMDFPFWKKIKLWKIAKPIYDKLKLTKQVDVDELILKHLNKK